MVEHKKKKGWYAAGLVVLLGVSIWYFHDGLSCLWVWLRKTPDGSESHITTARSVFLALAAVTGLGLAVWRARVADRQSKTAQRSLLNERYQKGAEMLGSHVLAVRLGGIYDLTHLAHVHPREYHVQIMKLFCAFVHNPTIEDGEDAGSTNRHIHQGPEKLRPDIQEIMTAIGKRSDTQIEMEKQERPTYRLDLRKAELGSVFLRFANLVRVDLPGANLTSANLGHVKLDGANLLNANLTNAKLGSCKGLTQGRLNQARTVEGKPPKLDNALDAKTGKQLEWCGKPLKE